MQDHKEETAQGEPSSIAAQDVMGAQVLPAPAALEREPIPQLKQIVEGAILAAHKPLDIDRLMSLFDAHKQPSRADVRRVLEEIQDDFKGRGFELKRIASGYRFQVRQDYSEWIGRLWDEKPPKYTRAFLETLALIAYKQPITRGDIEGIRGVTVSTNIMRSLLEREWIRIVGHRDVPGRPAVYATTREFLDYFNLVNLDQLPSLAEIQDMDGVNEELDMSGEDIIQPRTLSLEDKEHLEGETEEASLEQVTARVNEIQENIQHLLREPEVHEPDSDLEDEQSMAAPVEVPVADTSDLDTKQRGRQSDPQDN